MDERTKKNILNVDDNDALRYTVSRILRQADFDVIEAATGRDALRLVGECPDLVILDVNLPDMSGFEVCKKIKADPDTASIPVLHLSATRVRSADRVEGLDRGADGYLVHPVEPEELLATIRALLRMKQAEVRAEQKQRELEKALAEIKVLSGLLPICMHCKKIRDEKGYWNQLEAYISEHSEALFSHSLCEECLKKLYPDYVEKIKGEKE